MAAYDYRCRVCDSVFEVHRPVTTDAVEVRCPNGHGAVNRVWSAVALAGNASAPAVARAAAGSGGCCGGACGCGH